MYRGQVTAVDAKGVYVLVPSLHPTAPFGPLDHVGARPAVGARVLVADCGDESAPDLVVMTGSGPATSTDNAVARFDGTGGALQTSGVTISDTNVVGGLGAPAAATDAATKGYVDDRMPCGSVTAFAGSSAPTGWLLCYGQTVSRTTYAALYAIIGTTYGGGDGSTTFNLPDLRGRTVAGLDNMGGLDAGRLDWANTLGTAGGAQTHTLSAAESGVPAHSHGITDPGHFHATDSPVNFAGSGAYQGASAVAKGNTGSKTTGITVKNNTAAAASTAHNNMQPTTLLNYIIRT